MGGRNLTRGQSKATCKSVLCTKTGETAGGMREVSDFTYAPPESNVFLHTLRLALEAGGRPSLSALLAGAQCEFHTDGQFSRARWNEYNAELRLRVDIAKLPQFTHQVRSEILAIAGSVMPSEVGYGLNDITVSPFLVPPPDENDPLPNATIMKGASTIPHDGLHFRSKTETRIYDTLQKRPVLFFPNATAVLGSKPSDPKFPNKNKREPDFLICQDGKWGILEVMGESFHSAATAMRDHDRARLFDDYGVRCIHFYEASRCYSDPEAVVSDFLSRLARS